jgi:YVTN family beta-propeller protein
MKSKSSPINRFFGRIPIGWIAIVTAVAFGPSLARLQAARAYVTFSGGVPSVKVVDLDTSTVVGTIPVAPSPFDIAISPDGTRAYVTHTQYEDPRPASVSAIDTASGRVIATIPLVPASPPVDIAITPDGARAYVAVGPSVAVIDTAENRVLTLISVGGLAQGVAIGPDGARAYVTQQPRQSDYGLPVVLVIDTDSNTVVGRIAVGLFPSRIAITPDGTQAYVIHQFTNSVSVIDLGRETVSATIAVGAYANGLAITPDGALAYVVTGITVSVIDTASKTVTSTVAGGWNFTSGVAAAPDASLAYLADGDRLGGVTPTALVASIRIPDPGVARRLAIAAK